MLCEAQREGFVKRSKFSEEQVVYALRQEEAGTAVDDVCRQLGASRATFYAWKKKYAYLGVSELRRLRQLEEENTRLKRLVADLSLDKHMLSEALGKKVGSPHVAASWPGGSRTPTRSVACGPADWRSSVARPGIGKVERGIRRLFASASSLMHARALGSSASGYSFAGRAGQSTRSACTGCIGSRACNSACASDAANITPCIAGPRPCGTML